MPSGGPSMNLESLHAISTMVAQRREVEAVLDTIVDLLIDRSDMALARIWLTFPGDICGSCFLRDECPDRSRCLHLVASAARAQNPESGDQWHRTDGFYRRLPLGVRRIGEIAVSADSVRLLETADDDGWFARNDWLRREGVQSFCGHPLIFRDDVLGVMAVFSRSLVSDQEFAWLRAFADSAAVAIANARAFEEIETLRSQLELENEYLRDEIRSSHVAGEMIGESPGAKKLLEQIELVAPTDSTVLILGESGVGKELVARAIHEQSTRADCPLVKVNCASIPRELFESEFFGHVEGSFTSASRDRAGRFEMADRGTLFLDEVGEIPLEGTYERVGDDVTRSANVRVVAATNRDLPREVEAGRFRQDLYYRLSVFPIDVPPLRDRRDDIPRLAAHFLEQSSRKIGIATPKLRQRHIIDLQQYRWPGNIRELQNVVERAVISTRSGRLDFQLPSPAIKSSEELSPVAADDSVEPLTEAEIRSFERQNLVAVLNCKNWKVSGAGGAAEFLGVHPATLASRMRAMGIQRPRSR